MRPWLVLVLVGLLGGLAAAPAGASTMTIGFSADPTQDKPITVTVSGNASGARRLHAFVTTGSCSTYLGGQGGTRLSSTAGEAVNGAYSQNYVFTPTSRWPYSVCVFLVNASGGALDMTASRDVTPRGGQASASVGFSADPTQDKPVTVSVSGSSELPRRLHVFVTEGSCSTYLNGQGGTRLTPSGGVAVDGGFSHDYVFTPARQWPYDVCVFVERSAGELDATARGVVTPRRINATAAIAIASTAVPGQQVPLVVSGSSELPRRLHVFVTEGSCSTYLNGQGGTRLTPSEGVEVNGTYSQSYAFTPQREWIYDVCAFMTRGPNGELEATGRASTAIGIPRQGDDRRDGDGRQPVPDAAPATLLTPASGATGTLLSPTFTWTSADAARDIMVLEYREGNQFRPYIAVWAHGASWVSAGDFKNVEKLLDALGDRDEKANGWASFLANGSQATVRFGKAIEPGRYRWLVYTGLASESGTLVPSEQREFTVHGPALRTLQVRTRARKGSSTKSPGSTDLRISVTRYAGVRVELRRGGRRSVRNYSAGNSTSITAPVEWSCSKPGGRYRYRVIARDTHGKQLVRSGSFRPVSVARCRTMRKQEQRAKAARQREVDRRVAERRRAEAAAQQGRINRFKSNCRKLGGTPELIRTGDGSYWVCVSPWGGTWNVPY